ncbi:MAG TPA: biotin/lipoyl-containing protein [Pseudonocardiaceae bacterium]|nr:biotin/lipoyl-containing protein [Pseudonocardiaceae bacterium]
MTLDGLADELACGKYLSQDRLQLLCVVSEIVSRVLADSPAQPGQLRVSAGDVAVEIRWPRHPARHTKSIPEEGASVAAIPVESANCWIRADTVGTFYRAPEPGAAPFVQVGDLVSPGQQLGIIEAMKLMIPICSDIDGQLTSVLVEDGAPVEYDQPLFAIAMVNTG